MRCFLLDWPVPDVLASASGIAFSTPPGITNQKARFPFFPTFSSALAPERLCHLPAGYDAPTLPVWSQLAVLAFLVATLRSCDKELCFLPVQPLPAPVGQPDGATVRLKRDQVLTESVLVHAVAGVSPMYGLTCIDGGLDLFECHDRPLAILLQLKTRSARRPVRIQRSGQECPMCRHRPRAAGTPVAGRR